MRAIYDPEADTLDIVFRDEAVAESDKVREEIIVDFDSDGRLVSIEVLNASEHVHEPQTMVYQVKGLKTTSC
jgi:uncharacterized protein YuzE